MIEFLELQPGSNQVRFLTNPYQYKSHSMFKVLDTPNYGQRLKCAGLLGEHLKCPLCLEVNKPSARWIVSAFCYRTENVKLIDFGFEIFSNVRVLAQHHAWGNPETYDLDLIAPEYGDQSFKVVPYNKNSDFDSSKYPVDREILKQLTSPSVKDLDLIVGNQYEEVKRGRY